MSNSFTEKDVEFGGDTHVVDWDGEDDPKNPMNWPSWRKVLTVSIVSAISFVTPLASSIFAPGIPQVMREFNPTNAELSSFVVSVYVLGFAIGPLVLAPASELYGRSIIYNVSNVCFFICTVLCAESRSIAMLSAFRFLAGCFGGAPLTIGGGTIADVIPLERRGGAMAVYTLGPLLGPVIGPVGGGYLTEAKGWRWVFWLIAIISGVTTIATFLFLPETHAQTLLEKKAARLRKSTNNPNLQSKLASTLPPKEVFLQALVRPAKMFCMSPVILLLSTFMAIVYGYLYLMFTTFPTVFQSQYHFSTGSVGVSYLGMGIGFLSGLTLNGLISDRIQIARTAASGVSKPEYRLIPMVYGAVCIPLGLFWYGWSAELRAHWIVPILGTCLVGGGMIGTFLPIMTYLVDAFTLYAASAVAALMVLRSVVGAVLPLCGEGMYRAMGLGWGNSLLAFIAVALLPVPVLVERYGERLRKRFDVRF